MAPEKLEETMAALYEHFFVFIKPIVNLDDFKPVLEVELGKELANIVTAQMGEKGKEILTQNTEQAIADGAFGLPYFVGRLQHSPN